MHQHTCRRCCILFHDAAIGMGHQQCTLDVFLIMLRSIEPFLLFFIRDTKGYDKVHELEDQERSNEDSLSTKMAFPLENVQC